MQEILLCPLCEAFWGKNIQKPYTVMSCETAQGEHASYCAIYFWITADHIQAIYMLAKLVKISHFAWCMSKKTPGLKRNLLPMYCEVYGIILYTSVHMDMHEIICKSPYRPVALFSIVWMK